MVVAFVELMLTACFSNFRLMNFLQQPAGRELRRRLWGETLAEISKYTNIPEYLAA